MHQPFGFVGDARVAPCQRDAGWVLPELLRGGTSGWPQAMAHCLFRRPLREPRTPPLLAVRLPLLPALAPDVDQGGVVPLVGDHLVDERPPTVLHEVVANGAGGVGVLLLKVVPDEGHGRSVGYV